MKKRIYWVPVGRSPKEVDRVFVLPVYRQDANFYNSDIAIITLESPVPFSRNILPACLPGGNLTVTPYTTGVVSGWGIDEKRKETELKFIKVPIIDMMKCLKHVPGPFTKYMSYTSFCAGYINGTGVCNGDSGSGLLTKVNNRWVIQGIVSMSPRRGTSKYFHPRSYSLYTKVYIYKDWISQVLEFGDKRRSNT